MKKYIQLQDTYKTKKGDIWINYTPQDTDIYINQDTQLLEKEETILHNPDWFAPYEEKKQYARSWEDLKEISGSLVDGLSNISGTLGLDTIYQHRNIYATENQARAALAEAQLSQLLKEIYDGENWKPDWDDFKQKKYCIVDIDYIKQLKGVINIKFFLAFPTEELAEQFLENHTELIEIYFNKYNW